MRESVGQDALYVRKMFGGTAMEPSHRYLILQATSTVLSIFVWFYARVLFSPKVDLRTFRFLQEGMGIGDVGMLGLSAYLAATAHPDKAMLTAQVVMAAFWGAVRVVFLVRHREA